MNRWAVGLVACAAVVLALVLVYPHVGEPQTAPAALAAGSGSAATAPAATGNASAATGNAPAASAPAATANAPAATTPYGQRFAALCAACHGPNGRIETPLTPVLAGQPSLYVITQLYLFREGRRSNEAMTAVAKTLTDDDLRGFSELIGTLPPVPPPPPATPSDPARMAKGQALAEQHKCFFCHGPALAGGEQVPLIGGQHEAYLQVSLRGFHDGSRPGYTQAMVAAVTEIPPEDLDTLAYYAARFRGPTAPPTGK